MRHLWVQGIRPTASADLPPPLMSPLDAHRRLRGPYTMGGALVAGLLPDALLRRPGSVAAHDIELRAVAPDLRHLVPARRESIAVRLPKPERILVHAPRRTLRLANGLCEFVHDQLSAADARPRSLVITGVHEADHTDTELLAVLLRRIPADLLTLVVCAPPEWRPADAALSAALADHADQVGHGGQVGHGEAPAVPPRAPGGLVDLDGVCDDPEVHARYARLDPQERMALHDRRADELAAHGGVGARLGAIPYHRLHGSDPAAALRALAFAIEWCLEAGFHHAVAEFGALALPLADPRSDHAAWWRILHSTATALASLAREEEAEALFDLARRESTSPQAHASAAYSSAMLRTRHHDPAKRDVDGALALVNQAIAISTLLPDPAERAFKLGFDYNGKALIQMRRGRIDEAADLVEQAIALAETGLPPGTHPIHRLVLRANRAQLAARRGRTADALADLGAAIDADPGYPDYYLDRGNVHYRLGGYAEAVADYETAMRVGPPFPEPYYNRAEARFALGDHDGALADLDRALELDPDFADAYANRAGLLAALGDHQAAKRDAERGLALTPGDPYLLCALGQAEMAEGRTPEARAAFDHALELDPALASAWANRGILQHENGDHEAAARDLTRALDLGEDPALLFNRAMALRAAGHPDEAERDLRRALELAPDDEDIRRELHPAHS
ncbi:Flp pilus assembly protein TadD, contains TPR repeats [Sinosporangium album]|uniref:Flp pilus assembly protein TadD, contains TPR repeats n=1 Tax=Sinosporangium album TaxID=504805 RepID=A0A1G7WKG7_9ACTN|nr:tetratricopeptide repeat protein [Sinosporangium album]SDG72495.1 Flp pilus assembly protein TadD, contains TPR repeats [Sinosporangium album]